jgi:vacuolar-type H+-ATPase subunit H
LKFSGSMINTQKKSKILREKLDSRAWSILDDGKSELSTYSREISQQNSQTIFTHIVRHSSVI